MHIAESAQPKPGILPSMQETFIALKSFAVALAWPGFAGVWKVWWVASPDRHNPTSRGLESVCERDDVSNNVWDFAFSRGLSLALCKNSPSRGVSNYCGPQRDPSQCLTGSRLDPNVLGLNLLVSKDGTGDLCRESRDSLTMSQNLARNIPWLLLFLALLSMQLPARFVLNATI